MRQSFIINLARGPLVYERGMLWTSGGKKINPDDFCGLRIRGGLSVEEPDPK